MGGAAALHVVQIKVLYKQFEATFACKAGSTELCYEISGCDVVLLCWCRVSWTLAMMMKAGGFAVETNAVLEI